MAETQRILLGYSLGLRVDKNVRPSVGNVQLGTRSAIDHDPALPRELEKERVDGCTPGSNAPPEISSDRAVMWMAGFGRGEN